MKAAVVVADFYADIAEGLLGSCAGKLREADVGFEVFRAPGALEIAPVLAAVLADFDLAVALGCVIRGETYHFEVVARTSADAIMRAQMAAGKAVGNGVLTVENKAQAMARLGKGGEAAAAALAVAEILRRRREL